MLFRLTSSPAPAVCLRALVLFGAAACSADGKSAKAPTGTESPMDGAAAAVGSDARTTPDARQSPSVADARVTPRPDGGAGSIPPPPPAAPLDAAGFDFSPGIDGSGAPMTVATVAIDFQGSLPSPTSPKIPATLRVYTHTLANADYRQTYGELQSAPLGLQSPILLGGHGNSSWDAYPMKSLEFDVVDAMAMEKDVPILGLPPHSDWGMWACYADVSCLHNWFSYELGREMGSWAPRTHFAEVFLNGSYNGLYMLQEPVRRGKYRVNIPKPAADATAGDITGGYILKFNSSKYPGDQFRSRMGTPWNYHHPQHDVATPAQKAYLKEYVDKLEAAFAGANWTDPERGYRPLIDMPSWVDHVIVQELSNNPDAYWRSQYLFKQPDAAGGKMHLGPLWDFDLAWGISSLRDSFNYDFFSYVRGPGPNGAPGPYPFFLIKIWSDPAFQRAVRCRWQNLRQSVLRVEKMHAQIDAGAAAIAQAEARHHKRWTVLGQSGLPPIKGNSTRPTYQENIDFFKTWISNRVAWMDANLPGTCQ